MSNSEEIWGPIDLKIRRLIRELLEPSISRINHTEAAQEKLTKGLQETRERINTLQGRIDALSSKMPNIDPLSRKIAETTVKLNTLQSDLSLQVAVLKNSHDSNSNKLDDLYSQVVAIYKQTDFFKQALKENSSICMGLRSFVEEQVQEFRRNVKEPFNTQAETNVSLQAQILGMDQKIEILLKDVNAVDYLAKKCEQDIKIRLGGIERKMNLQPKASYFENEINRMRNLIQSTQERVKQEIADMQEGVKKQVEETLDEFGKINESNLGEILDFVLVEPKYKKKINELRKMSSFAYANKPKGEIRRFTVTELNIKEFQNEKKTNFRKFKKTAEIHFLPEQISDSVTSNIDTPREVVQPTSEEIENGLHSPISERLSINIAETDALGSGISTLETQETGENPVKFTFSHKESSASDLESISEEDSIDLGIILEDVQKKVADLAAKVENLTASVQSNVSKSSIKLNSFKYSLGLLKQHFEKNNEEMPELLESKLKAWTKAYTDPLFANLEKRIEEFDDLHGKDLQGLIQSNTSLETLLKNSVSEFTIFVSNRKRENIDIKLDIKRIYSKIDSLCKKHVITLNFMEKVQNLMETIKAFVALHAHKTSESDLEDSKKQFSNMSFLQTTKEKSFGDKQKSLLEALNNEIDAISQNTNFGLPRSNTPDLPMIGRIR